MPVWQLDATHARRTSSHRTHIGFLETNGLAVTCDQQNLSLAIGNFNVHELVIVTQIDRDNAA